MTEKKRNAAAKTKLILKILIGLFTLASLILWSGGFFSAKLPPGEVSAQTGIPIPMDRKTFKVHRNNIPKETLTNSLYRPTWDVYASLQEILMNFTDLLMFQKP